MASGAGWAQEGHPARKKVAKRPKMTDIHRRSTRPGVTQTPGSRYRGASGSEPLAPIREIGYRRGGTIGGEGERLRIGTVNVGTMRGGEGDGCGWRGEVKVFWRGGGEGGGGVGIMVARKWVDNVIGVERVSERVMVVKVTVGKVILCMVSVYGPQMGRLMEEKEGFYVELGGVVDGFGEQEV